MNPTEQAIREVLRRWYEAPKADVITFPTPSERMRREWMKKWTQPMDDKPRPPHNPPPRAA